MAAFLAVCTIEKQKPVNTFLWSEGMNEIHRKMLQQYKDFNLKVFFFFIIMYALVWPQGFPILQHLLYRHDVVPSDYHMFAALKDALRGHSRLKAQPKTFFLTE